MEFYGLYDINRIPTNESLERGRIPNKDKFITVVHLALFNREGKMLIQKRSKDKKSWANIWDVSVGGTPVAGETSIQGIQRETKEELGLEIDFSEKRPSLTYSFSYGFDDFYTLVMDISLDEIRIQEEEVQEVKFASKEEIFKLIDNKEFINYNKDFISLIFYMKDNDSIIK